jgi:hypothetical protein
MTQTASNRRLWSLLAAVLAALLIATLAPPVGRAGAASVGPEYVAGNPTCATLTGIDRELKVEPVTNGTFSNAYGSVTITNKVGNSLAFTASPRVLAVYLKAGPGGNLYDYRPDGTLGDTNLVSPVSDSISHVSFCFGLPQPSTALSVAASASVVHSGDQVTLTWTETNDGEVALNNPSVTGDNGCTPAYVSGDTNSNGKLDIGESWVFTCTVTVTATTTFTGLGNGIDPGTGKNVTWCADVNSPPAGVHCDQDERAQTEITVINPSTDLSVAASATTVYSGGSVVLTWTEQNDGNAPLSSPYLNVDNGCTAVYDSGDTNTNGKLDPGESWVFKCTVNPTTTTTYTGIAGGIDATGADVTYCADPAVPPTGVFCDQDERAQVTVNVVNPSTALSASATATTINLGDSTVISWSEANDGNAPLTNVSVETNQADCVPAYASGDTNGDGVLDPGETWVFTCTVSPLVTTTYVGTAHGTDPLGNDVTWCADPTAPPAGVLCDQDERAQITITVVELDEGCTPGYWKNHTGSWGPTGYAPSQSVGSVFSSASPYHTSTLLEALDFGGGSGVNGAKQILLRAGTASLLNAAHPDVDFSISAASVISQVNTALASGNRSTMLAKAAELDLANNSMCPLN